MDTDTNKNGRSLIKRLLEDPYATGNVKELKVLKR